jgi:HK97 family phage portal protein
MFYRKNPNPLDPTGRGIGRVEQIGDEVETDEYMAKFAKRFFFNDATPNILITAPDETDDEEIQNAERRWFQKFGGIGNSNKAAFLNWDAKVHILNTSNREMDFVESRKFYRDLAIQHFGIPPEIMGNVENSNKATVVAAQDIYLKQVIHPQLIEFEEVITWQLLKQFKNSEDLIFLFDRETVEDKEFEMKSINEAYQLGGITIDEYRGRVGDLLNMNLAALPNGQGNRLIFKGKITIIDLNTEEIIDGSTDEGGEPQDEQDKKFIIDDSG